MSKTRVGLGLLGVTLDRGEGAGRWEQWRPSVALLAHEDLVFDRFELLHQKRFTRTAEVVAADMGRVSPETEVRLHPIEFRNPWDFQDVYGALLDFAESCRFEPEREDYLVHITTGTHVAQICLFLLTEARFIPGRLVQTSPPTDRTRKERHGSYAIIDLDLSKYDRIASRFAKREASDLSFLKAGIDTRDPAFNAIIENIERVVVASRAPILLTGPTGVGKSQLARRIYELKKRRRQAEGELVEVNCATLRGDGAMSALFGHTKGAFTGAQTARAGLLRAAHGGVLFLDEIGELGADEQAMLLRSIEQKSFLPLGADRELTSDFQLIAGTNRDLRLAVREGRFREDLLARINLWTFQLPPLKDRTADLEPNLDFEILALERSLGHRVAFNKEARERFLTFARRASWPGNFRDFHAAIERLATLAGDERISEKLVAEELGRLERAWRVGGDAEPQGEGPRVDRYLDARTRAELDPFDRAQLEEVLRVCEGSSSLSEAGRTLFASSRRRRSSTNDADRLRKYLARFRVDWRAVMGSV